MTILSDLPQEAFDKADSTPDTLFYRQPRFVTHIDDAAIAAVTALYSALLPDGGTVLDVMSSWVSHLPPERAYGAVIGHGLNADELAANARLTRRLVQDLNADPDLPIAADSLDAAVMCVSVQYLQQPVAVLSGLHRQLRPGGVMIITFSNRCFPTKAVSLWHGLDGAGRKTLVSLYLQDAGFAEIQAIDLVPEGGRSDPLHAVIGRKHSGAA